MRRHEGIHITRYSMYTALHQVLAEQPEGRVRGEGLTALALSASGSLCRRIGLQSAAIEETSFPEVDLLDLAYEDATFDVVVSDQVLEHIAGDPYQAMGEAFRVLKPGGLAVHTTCFMNPVHRVPVDHWRFTPEALALLCPDAEVLEAGGWGNAAAVMMLALGLRETKVPTARWHPVRWAATHNDDAWPIVTWVVARKAL